MRHAALMAHVIPSLTVGVLYRHKGGSEGKRTEEGVGRDVDSIEFRVADLDALGVQSAVDCGSDFESCSGGGGGERRTTSGLGRIDYRWR